MGGWGVVVVKQGWFYCTQIQYINLFGPKLENTPEGGVTVAPVRVPIVSKIIESLGMCLQKWSW